MKKQAINLRALKWLGIGGGAAGAAGLFGAAALKGRRQAESTVSSTPVSTVPNQSGRVHGVSEFTDSDIAESKRPPSPPEPPGGFPTIESVTGPIAPADRVTINMGDLLRQEVYGPGLEQEIGKADRYNKVVGAPYRMGAYLSIKPGLALSSSPVTSQTLIRYNKVNRPLVNNDFLIQLKKHYGPVAQLTRSQAMYLPGLGMRQNEWHTPIEAVRHEAAHVATARPNKQAIPNWFVQIAGQQPAVSSEAMQYPELDADEYIPPAAALQQHLYQTTGKRIESPEEYERFVAPYKGAKTREELDKAIEKLPLEVKRMLRYRFEAGEGPRRNRMDKIWRTITPGIVRAEPRQVRKTAMTKEAQTLSYLSMLKFANQNFEKTAISPKFILPLMAGLGGLGLIGGQAMKPKSPPEPAPDTIVHPPQFKEKIPGGNPLNAATV